MTEAEKNVNAEVTAVYPNKVRIAVKELKDFSIAGEKLTVGSYVRVSDHENCAIIAVIENYMIEQTERDGERKYIIEANPIGFLDTEGIFHRGGTSIAIPPIGASPAKKADIQSIYSQVEDKKQFCFGELSQLEGIRVPVDGDSFFNKHIAVVGSTGSGKSHTMATIIQKAVLQKDSEYTGLNNSHIIIFDLHGEYSTAFPEANIIGVDNLRLPYWLMNEEELEELLVERRGEGQAYNQASLLRRIITHNKERASGNPKVTFGSPVKFSIDQVLNCLINLSKETVNYEKVSEACVKSGRTEFQSDEELFDCYSEAVKEFEPINGKRTGDEGVKKGTYNDGSLEKFINRINGKIKGERLRFLFDESQDELTFEDVLRQLLAYEGGKEKNVTLIDLSGIPFEVLSITVSLISRLLFEYGYYFKRFELGQEAEVPLLLVYEEAHKYVPKSAGARYEACRTSIERVAKEGRKYGCTLVIMSQRPSEVSETIFSQCNNFIAMRLTNPEDQNYVRRLLPDSLGPLTDSLPTLKQGEALLIGGAVIMPSLVKIDRCNPAPSSNDIPYLQEWKKQWQNVAFATLASKWTGTT